VEDVVSAPALQGWGGGAAGRMGRPSAREGKEGKGVDDRIEETTKGIEEQRALYTRAKRRAGAFPDREGLNPKGRRTGTFFKNVFYDGNFWSNTVGMVKGVGHSVVVRLVRPPGGLGIHLTTICAEL
jgi:hypothetical protein